MNMIAKQYTAVGRTVDGNMKTLNFTLVSEDYMISSAKVEDIVKSMKKGSVDVVNLEPKDGTLAFANGAEKKYTTISAADGSFVTKPSAVIIDRVEDKSGKIVGYTVFMASGSLERVSVSAAVQAAMQGMIANGKIRHTSEGDIVSSIKGNYRLCTIDLDSAAKSDAKINLAVLFFANAINQQKQIPYVGVVVSCEAAAKQSKVLALAKESNTDLIKKLKEINATELDALKPQRISVSETYVVIELRAFVELIQQYGGVIKRSSKYIVSVLEYDCVNKEPVEAEAKLSEKFDIIELNIPGGMEKDVTDFVAKLSKLVSAVE